MPEVGVTVMPAVSLAVLKALLPPLVLTSAVPPLLPVQISQARKVMPAETVPRKFVFGTKRMRVLASDSRSREAEFDGEGSSHSARVAAVVAAMKHLGMFTEKLEVMGIHLPPGLFGYSY